MQLSDDMTMRKFTLTPAAVLLAMAAVPAARAATAPVIVPPQQGVPVTMPSSIAQNSNSGRGIGKAKEAECVVR